VSCEEKERSVSTTVYINKMAVGQKWNPIFTNFKLVEANEEFSVYAVLSTYHMKYYYVTTKHGKIVSIWTKAQYNL